MKLLSFAAAGKDWFGALRDDGVVTLNDKVAQPNLRAALAAAAMDNMRSAPNQSLPAAAKLKSFMRYFLCSRGSLRQIFVRTAHIVYVTLNS